MAKRILIIEDEATQVLLLESRLRASGFEIARAMSGEEGLEKARTLKPDLVLLDVILPGITGLEVSQRMREEEATRDIPVILVTASQMKDLETRSKIFGITALLTKPYAFADLLGKVNSLLPPESAAAPSNA